MSTNIRFHRFRGNLQRKAAAVKVRCVCLRSAARCATRNAGLVKYIVLFTALAKKYWSRDVSLRGCIWELSLDGQCFFMPVSGTFPLWS